MLLTLFKLISSSTPLLLVFTVLEVIAVAVMKQKADALTAEAPEQGNPPDLWFGVPEDAFQNWLDGVGEKGRVLYLAINTWDITVYMWAYMILSGALMYGQCQKVKPSLTTLSLIFPLAMAGDFVETILFRKATNGFPTPLGPVSLKIMSLANMTKWSAMGVGLVLLIGLSAKNRMSKESTTAETAKTK
ncbi:MAG: hypothetical protein SGBAC_010589 [Bacillariaceae sp.]